MRLPRSIQNNRQILLSARKAHAQQSFNVQKKSQTFKKIFLKICKHLLFTFKRNRKKEIREFFFFQFCFWALKWAKWFWTWSIERKKIEFYF